MVMPKGIHALELNEGKPQELWRQVNKIPALWDDFTANRPQVFFQNLVSRNSIWLERDDGNGILYLLNIVAGLSASGHVVYWDGRLKGREAETIEALCWVMEEAMLLKVNLYVPDYAHSVRQFARRMGFRQEGCIRRWSFSQGKAFDIYVMGILREEAFARMEEQDGAIHGTVSDDISTGEPGVRPDAAGLDKPATGDGDTGDPPVGGSSSERERDDIEAGAGT